MKKFNFKLEKVLRIKKFNEEECKMALGQAISVLNLIEKQIMQTAVKRHNAASQRFNDPAQMIFWDTYILRLEREAEQLAEKAAQAEMVVEEKRVLYQEAYKELKAIEKLKEKRYEEYRKDYFVSEMNQIDELTSARQIMNL
ncbi:MAG: flagellar export protein FliJ [Treponema sp.]|nr:flagellar export protein FliJ [Treponema sp.]